MASSSNHREGVNPLRPYYIPPSIGESLPSETSKPNPFASPSSSGPARGSLGNATTSRATAGPPGGARYASKARDLFSDIDYKEYISEPSPSAVQTVKDLIDESLWKYMSVLMAQPFEVARTILQVRSQESTSAPAALGLTPGEEPRLLRTGSVYDELSDDDDEPNYFTSNLPHTPTPSHSRATQRNRDPVPPQSPHVGAKVPSQPVGHLAMQKPDSILEVIQQLWQKEGTWGVWKASNASYVYSVLQSLLENWSRSLLSALFNVPDLGVKDDVDRLVDIASPYPWASFAVAAGAAVATGLILAPLDLVRTRLILTSVARQPRHSIAMLRNLPSYVCPPVLMLPTILHSLVHPVLTLSAPLMLRSRFGIDRGLSPASFSVAKFCSSTVALFVKLPLETVLRRGQVAVLSDLVYLQALEAPAAGSVGTSFAGVPSRLETIVPRGRYDGVFGTMRHIVFNEGSRTMPAPPPSKVKNGSRKGRSKTAPEPVVVKGQGMEGLWRGWKVSWWGLVGLWTAGVLGGGGDGEF